MCQLRSNPRDSAQGCVLSVVITYGSRGEIAAPVSVGGWPSRQCHRFASDAVSAGSTRVIHQHTRSIDDDDYSARDTADVLRHQH